MRRHRYMGDNGLGEANDIGVARERGADREGQMRRVCRLWMDKCCGVLARAQLRFK